MSRRTEQEQRWDAASEIFGEKPSDEGTWLNDAKQKLLIQLRPVLTKTRDIHLVFSCPIFGVRFLH